MRELEPIVTSFNVSQRLKEMGVKQHDSLFVWHHSFVMQRKGLVAIKPEETVAAFTAQELLVLFPRRIHIDRNDGMWYVGFNLPGEKGKMEMWIPNEENLANVLGKKLLTLLKNKKEKTDKFKNIRRIK